MGGRKKCTEEVQFNERSGGNRSRVEPKAEYLFEVSWEVCNKVGGIHTVIKSKASITKDTYDNYLLIGPYFEDKAEMVFEEKKTPRYIKKALSNLKNREDGKRIKAYFGEWKKKGNPDVLLIDFSNLKEKKDEFKSELWERYNIDSLNSGWSFEEPIIFSKAVAMILEEIDKVVSGKRKKVAHFHEWMVASSILFLEKDYVPSLKTVFTTHATMLGRAIAGSGSPLHEILDSLNPKKCAYQYGVEAKYLTEKRCAEEADVFTTVSKTIAKEANKILGVKPDLILPNGCDVSKYPTFEELSVKHGTCREIIRKDFLIPYFFPHYSMNLEHNLILFTAGRYEMKNKGIDLTIDALAKLNKMMKENPPAEKRTVTCFFWIPISNGRVKTQLLENKNYYNNMKNYVEANSDEILKNILTLLVSGEEIEELSVIPEDFKREAKKNLLNFKREGNPVLCTNCMEDEENNKIVNRLREVGLDNKKDDPVKTILQPVYLDGNDSLLNLEYKNAISGSHLGLFPSYYEPWGYTPLDTISMGVPALTSDLSGFGKFIKEKVPKEDSGVLVLKREGKEYDKVVENYSQTLYDFLSRHKNGRVSMKINAKQLSKLCDWKKFINNYIEAHNQALKKDE